MGGPDWLEGKDGFADNVVAEQGLEGLAVDDAGGSGEQRSEEEFEAGVLKYADGAGGVEIEQDVHVAGGRGLSAGDGAEDGGMLDTQGFEFLLAGSKGFEGGVELHGGGPAGL